MNRNILKMSLKINILSHLSILLVLFSFILSYVQFSTENNWFDLNEKSAYIHMLGIDSSGEGSFLFVFSLPFICAAYGASILENDKKNRISNLIVSRSKKKDYIKTYALSSFLLGGIASITPFVIHSWISFMLYPAISIDKYSTWFPLYGSVFYFDKLFSTYPFVFWMICLLFYFFLGGLYSLSGFVISFYNKSRYIETIIPFIVVIIIWLLSSLTGFIQASPIIWSSFGHASMFADQLTISPRIFFFIETFPILILNIILVYRESRKDEI